MKDQDQKKRKKLNLFDALTGHGRDNKKGAGKKDMESPRNFKFFFKLFGCFQYAFPSDRFLYYKPR